MDNSSESPAADTGEDTLRAWNTPKLTVLSISETRAGIFEAENEGAFIFFGRPGDGGCIIGPNCNGIS